MKLPERLVWALAVIAILAWSLISRRESAERSKPVASEESLPTRERDRSSLAPDDSDHSRQRRKSQEVSDRSSVGTRSLHALRSGDPLTRLSGFLKILESADAANFDQVSSALSELKATGASLPVEEDLMNYRAGQLKGEELMAGKTGSSEDFAMIGTLKKQYEGWVQADPHAAGRWLEGLPVGKYRDQMAVTYIAASTKDDPVGSLNLVSSLHPSQQAAAGRAVAERLIESASAEEAATLFRTLEANAGGVGKRYLSTMFDSLVSGKENGNSEFALSLVERNLDQPFVKGATLARVSADRAKTDPEGALAWAVSMEGKKADLRHGDIVVSAIQGMTVDGLAHARTWAATQQDGAGYWLKMIEEREKLLQERRGGENEYDKDD